jgi:hypothetical protein
VSSDSPEWFKIYDKEKLKNVENYYVNNNQSLHVLSRFNRWITITPRSKNRRLPLENVKLVKYTYLYDYLIYRQI